ncbi:hypothetical protein OHB54_10535 [Streptomyces sp. NBC_01007]|nr:hypothetical protein OHB54_10535 [Streptomyces sp. NBC_01007]
MSHATGGADGEPGDHWAAIESTPGLQCGVIRGAWDRAILQRVNDGRSAGFGGAGPYDDDGTAKRHHRAYGGDPTATSVYAYRLR